MPTTTCNHCGAPCHISEANRAAGAEAYCSEVCAAAKAGDLLPPRPETRATWGGGGVSVIATTASALRDGKPVVGVDWGKRWCEYWPLDGDEETARMIRLCAAGELLPAILADRIDEVEPAPGGAAFPDFTAAMRGAGRLIFVDEFAPAVME